MAFNCKDEGLKYDKQVLVFLIIVSVSLKLLGIFESSDILNDCLLNSWAVLLNVSVNKSPITSGLRLVLLSWIVVSIALTTVFQTFMTSFFIDPGKQYQIDSLKELDESNFNMSLAVLDARNWHGMTNRSSFWVFLHGDADMIQFAIQNDSEMALLTSEEVFLYSIREMCALNSTDKFHKFTSYGLRVHQIMNINNLSPYLPAVNQIIRRLGEAGIVEQIVDNIVDPTGVRRISTRDESSSNEYVPLTILHVFFSFLYFLGGLCLSCIVFIMEILVSKCCKCK